MIDGGADVFLEYGFRQVVSLMYTQGDNSIQAEIYEMQDDSAAFGAWANFAPENATGLALGDTSVISDYFLFMVKANYFISLTGNNAENTTGKGLLEIGNAIGRKIKDKGARPKLLDCLYYQDLSPQRVKYITGNIALNNNYIFSADDIFNVHEAVIGTYGETRLFVFKYSNAVEAATILSKAGPSMKANIKYTGFSERGSSFMVTDRFFRELEIGALHQYIYVLMGEDKSILGRWKEKLHLR
jgi:hypothetical protein